MAKVGIVDTTFSRVDMHSFVEETLKGKVNLERYTVPGIKDTPVAAKILFGRYGCDIVIVLGMVGPQLVDKTCGHEASSAIQTVMLQEGKHILEVFVHMNEVKTDSALFALAKNRTTKHALNALKLLESKTALSQNAGKGLRQGFDDEGPVIERKGR